MKGYFAPDTQLRKDKGYDILGYMYTHNPIVFSSINYVTASLFSLRRDKHFEMVCSKPEWRQFFSELLIAYNPPKGLYGQAYDLANFLEGVLQSLLVFGKAFYKIDYAQEECSQTGTRWTIQRIRWLAVETMNAISGDGRIKGFVQQYSDRCVDKNLRGARVEFAPDEVFFVEWVFDGDKNLGISPLMSLIPHHKKMKWFLELIEQQVYAMSHPQDRSYRIERARYTSWDKAKRVNETSQIKIRAALGTVLDAPMSQYYETYQLTKSRKRTALIREYLVNEFNAQAVNALSKRNSLIEPARIELVGYMSASEIEDLFRKFQNGQASQDEVLNTLKNDMI